MLNKMVVIIDMQNGFMDEQTQGLDEKILSFIKKLPKNIQVVGTRYVNHENTPCYIFEGWKDCMEGSEDSEVLESLKPALCRVFSKDRYSCWNEEFRRFVRENQVEKIYFAGVNTDCCVLHSAFDCYNDLTDCAVIEDLCASTAGKDVHLSALKVLRSCITSQRVVTSEQALGEILC